MSQHMIVRSRRSLASIEMHLPNEGGRAYLLPLKHGSYSSAVEAFGKRHVRDKFYALSDSERYFHCEYLIEKLVECSPTDDRNSSLAIGWVATGLFDLISSWPSPFDLYISDNPGCDPLHRLEIKMSEFVVAFEAITDSLWVLPDVVMTIVRDR